MGTGNGLFSELEKKAPGSVQVSKDGRSVTLIGWHLEKFDDSEHHKCETNNVECNSERFCVPWASRKLPIRAIKRVKNEHFLIRVIYPFPKPPKKCAGRNARCCSGRISRKKACSIQEKNKGSYDDYHLVPVVQGKLSQRILHFVNHLIQKISRDFKQISKRGKRG